MVRRILAAVAVVLVAALPVFGQSTAINGTIEGTVTDEQAPSCRASPSRWSTPIPVTRAWWSPTKAGSIARRCCSWAPTASKPNCRASRSSSDRCHAAAGQTAVIDFKLTVGTLQETVTVTADAPLVDLGKIEQGRTLNERRDQDPAAHLAQSLQFRAAAAGRRRLRDQRVRRAATHRQRRAAARELPGRRQQQHPEGPRRPAPDADVGGDDPRGARWSPPATRRSLARRWAWSTTPSRRRAPTPSAARPATGCSARRWWPRRSTRRRPRTSRRPT
jgi:hypothetical protein